MGKSTNRDKFRNDVLKRDGNKCKVCGRSDVKLDSHHVTDRSEMPNGGYVIENGITLCDTENGCHFKAERYHITDGKDWVDGYHPMELYKLIKSSESLAREKSKLL
jgi:CRISPR/Cas system-associated protein Cas10 (large subunit of type III CRISPR-Cas system)